MSWVDGGSAREGDCGSISVEVAVIAPALIAMLLMIVFAGRVAELDGTVQRAAGQAARAASLRQHPSDAVSDAARTARQNLAAAGAACEALDIEVNTEDFRPAGSVTVTVVCGVAMSDVARIGLPGRRTFTATSVEVVDAYRGEGP